MEIFRDERVKQVIVAVAILLGVMVLSVAIRLAGAAPGVLGEWFGMIAGFLSTPVLLEVSFFTIGLIIVVSVNHWRMKREGDEFVYLEQINEPELSVALPDQAKWAIYGEPPLPGEEPSLLDQAEGALAIGDFDAATAAIGAMGSDELYRPEVKSVRIALAKATGREDLVNRLENEG
ncbi:MAG: hypothetical protein CFE26_02375 [Verrucomicrobiales bacterium VVV1]|nr:MAG: hypothetical protein CFE26_02375 [Verrucomicrobiales bacterium VVV1]